MNEEVEAVHIDSLGKEERCAAGRGIGGAREGFFQVWTIPTKGLPPWLLEPQPPADATKRVFGIITVTCLILPPSNLLSLPEALRVAETHWKPAGKWEGNSAEKQRGECEK